MNIHVHTYWISILVPWDTLLRADLKRPLWPHRGGWLLRHGAYLLGGLMSNRGGSNEGSKKLIDSGCILKWEPTLSLCNFLAGATCPHISLVVQSRAGWETVCRVAMAEVAEINPLHFSYFCKDWDRGLGLGAYYPLWVLAEIPASGEARVNTFIFHCIVVFFNMEHLLAVYLLRLAGGQWFGAEERLDYVLLVYLHFSGMWFLETGNSSCLSQCPWGLERCLAHDMFCIWNEWWMNECLFPLFEIFFPQLFL